MRIQNEKAGSISLGKRLLGLSVAALTTMTAFLVAVPGAQAANSAGFEYKPEDGFVKGAIDTSKKPTLELTKYVTSSPNDGAPTGSISDAPSGKGTAANVNFILTEVKPKGGADPSTMKANDPQTYEEVVPSAKYSGTTDGLGKIVTGGTAPTGAVGVWRNVSNTSNTVEAAKTGSIAVFPGGQHWYLLTENPDTKPANHQISDNTIFGLPFGTRGKVVGDTGDYDNGYVYNLHIYPKNHSSGQLEKNATEIDRGTTGEFKKINGNEDKHVQIGDSVKYDITQNILNGDGAQGDGKLYRGKIKATGPQLKISDRLTSALQFGEATARISYVENGNTIVKPVTGFRVEGPDGNNPKRLADESQTMFVGPATSTDGTKYVSVIFDGNSWILPPTVPTEGVSNLQIIVTIKAKVVSANDSVGSTPGKLVNSASADFPDNKDNKDTTNPDNPNKPKPLDPPAKDELGAASFQVGKVDHSTNRPLAGAVFRLGKLDDPDQYLFSDGKFHKNGEPNLTATPIEAISDQNGVVSFVALPISDPNNAANIATNVQYTLKEYAAPQDHDLIPVGFKMVDFSQYAGQSWGAAMAAHPAGITPDLTKLNLGVYEATGANIKNADGVAVTKVIANWRGDEKGKPIGLPLTGGKGIILLLIVGLAIMGGVLVVRNRKNSSVSRSI
ncbi:LPXTG cell wall anchor domain-containing protein [Bombiscardovia coagulans]|uniref:Uncharacterized protein n=1 Tax=Bombiscardovia coagulans TaxID=686666 RepID=A0A261EQT8_9BIFI|nr:LPXTG cell wall anchor domain-containing protein [Bombiscardovia coagulans]OZG49217.1 hypothetical protein BOCO_1026 [Bombiscardovia coagulans]